MSIFDKLFGQTQPNQPNQMQQPNQNQNQNQNAGAGQPGNIPPNSNLDPASTPGGAPNGVVPNNVNPNPADPNASQLDNFNTLWQPNTDAPTEPQPLINVDPKSLAEAASKTNFVKMISPEQMQAIAAGGEGAVQAFAQAMNKVAQGVYAQSAFATTKIVEQAVAKAQERFTSEIPNHVKKLQVSESLRNENPALNHPAASPILGAIESQLTVKHPNASSTEITNMARQYLEQFATAVNKPREAAKAKQAAETNQGTDWNSFIS